MAHRVLLRASNFNVFRGLKRASPAMSCQYSGHGDDLGRGAGKGGGAGGSIREAGGAFGKREAGQEEEYFHRLQKEQIAKLHDHLHEEIEHHEEQLKHHKEAIEDIKKRLHTIKKDK